VIKKICTGNDKRVRDPYGQSTYIFANKKFMTWIDPARTDPIRTKSSRKNISCPDPGQKSLYQDI